MLPALLLVAQQLLSPPPGYEQAVSTLPTNHWSYVRSWHIDRDSNGRANEDDLSIHLTPWSLKTGGDSQLHHEVGHIFYYTHRDVARRWRATFWPNGSVVGPTVSKYGRTNDREDFATAYAEYIQHRGNLEQEQRRAFLDAYVFSGADSVPSSAVRPERESTTSGNGAGTEDSGRRKARGTSARLDTTLEFFLKS